MQRPIVIQINGKSFPATLEDNPTACAFVELAVCSSSLSEVSL